MAFTLDPQTGKITFGVVADGTNDAIARDIAQEFNVSETFNDNFSTNQWTDIGTSVSVDTINGRMDASDDSDGTYNSTRFDLTTTSDTEWVLRWKTTFNTITTRTTDPVRLYIGLFDNTGDDDTTQDALCLLFDEGPSFTVNLRAPDGVALEGSTSIDTFTDVPTQGEVRYYELRRTSATTAEASVYSDAQYTILIDTVSGAISANVTGTNFLMVKSGNRTDATGVVNLFVDDVQFWNGITVPVITSPNWRLRFELDVTNLDDGANNIEKRLYVGMFDEDEISGASNLQDGFLLLLNHDNTLNTFNVRTPDNEAPRNAGNDIVSTTSPAVDTFFVELKRDSVSQVTLKFYTDNTYTTTISSEAMSGISGTNNLKYLKIMNDEVSDDTGEASQGAIDGTIDNITFTDLDAGVIKDKEFTVNALIQSTGDVRCGGTSVLFFDGMNDASQWTSNTGQIVPNDIAGVMEWNNLTGGATVNERFAFRTIPNFDDDIGEIRIRLKVDKISDSVPGSAPTGRFMVVQNNALHPNPSTGSNIQLGLGSGTTNGGIFAGVNDGTNGVTTTPQIDFLDGTTRYLEAIYDPVGATLTLNVYTDANFTVHDTGSPAQVDASSVSMTGLTFTHIVTSNVKNSGPARVITADLDDFQIGGGSCPSPQVNAILFELVTVIDKEFIVNALLQSQGDNGCVNLKLFDQIGGNSGLWTSNSAQIVIDSGGSGVVEMNSLAGGGTTTSRRATRALNTSFLADIGVITIRQKVTKISGTNETAIFMAIQNGTGDASLVGASPRLLHAYDVAGGLFAQLSDGTNQVQASVPPIALGDGETQFVETIYDPVTQTLTLNSYSDSSFTNHVTGSPIQVDASIISMPSTLIDTVVSSNFTNSGAGKVITADLDDYQVTTGACPTVQVDALLQTQGDNGSCLSLISYTDDFSSNRFVDKDSTFITVGSGVIGFDAQTDNTNDASASDISLVGRFGSVLPPTWRIRFQITFNTYSIGNNNHMMFSIGDEDQNTNSETGSGSDEMSIGFHARTSTSPSVQNVRGYFKNGDTQNDTATALLQGDLDTMTGTKYYQMERTSDTSVTYSIFSDAGFTTLINSTVQTIPNLTGLQYFKVSNWKFDNSSEGNVIGNLDNLEIISGGTQGNTACADVDSQLILRPEEEFEVNALIQAQGENGNCPIPATETFYSRSKSPALAERLGEGVNSPFAGITRAGVRIAGATHAGKAIEDMRVLGIRRNGVGATGTMFATVRDDSDTVIATSTNSVLAQSLPTTGSGNDVTFTFDNKVVLQDGYRVLLEFPNCIGCADSSNEPNVFWFGTSTASPAGTERTFFGKSPSSSGSYTETTTGFTQGGIISFTTSPADPANQRACADVDVLLRATLIEEFQVDAFVFDLPVLNTFVDALLHAFDQEKDFFVDGCLRADLSVQFEVDACIETEGKRLFEVDAFVFILPVANAIVDAIVRYAQGTRLTGGIPDLIIRVLRENPPSLKGTEIVDEIVKITSDPAEGFSFRGKTSRIKNWLNRLLLDNLILNDESSPDWYRTNWSLAPGI